MADRGTGEVIAGLRRFEATHPEWTEDEGGEEGWAQNVAWWGVAVSRGLVLIDPIVDDWAAPDRRVENHPGCAGVLRTCHWHQRSIAEVAGRYHVGVWAKVHDGRTSPARDHVLRDRDEVCGELRVCPESWTQPEGGVARLRGILGDLTALPVEHVLCPTAPG